MEVVNSSCGLLVFILMESDRGWGFFLFCQLLSAFLAGSIHVIRWWSGAFYPFHHASVYVKALLRANFPSTPSDATSLVVNHKVKRTLFFCFYVFQTDALGYRLLIFDYEERDKNQDFGEIDCKNGFKSG